MPHTLRAPAIPNRFKLPYKLTLRNDRRDLPQSVLAEVDAFSAKVKRNTYAAMLKSPLRKCTFHDRVMPAAFLTRFTVGMDANTNTVWAVPTFGESHERGVGQGRYVAQNRSVLDAFDKTARYKYTFRNMAKFRSDMIDYVASNLSQLAFSATTQNLKKPSLMATLEQNNGVWTSLSNDDNQDLSFALLLNSLDNDMPNHRLRTIHDVSTKLHIQCIPFYSADALWGAKVADSLKQQIIDIGELKSIPPAIAFKADRQTLRNSISLWKLAGFFRNVDDTYTSTQGSTDS
ncbi:hypothetical protein Unana1_05567 [Umbelopsis nana]